MPKAWAMTDVFGLDDELLAMIPQPVSALLLLFPINNKVHIYLAQCGNLRIFLPLGFYVKLEYQKLSLFWVLN